jgi:hypothetical protein
VASFAKIVGSSILTKNTGHMKTQTPCTNCQQPLQALQLEGHYGNLVNIDICGNCHLVWFDEFESVRLSGLGWLQLLRAMLACPRSTASLPAQMQCVRCRTPLKAVRNLTRFGRTAALECSHGHGQFQGFSLLLAERGLVRPVNHLDRKALAQERRLLSCLNCGADASAQTDSVCAYCDSPLVMIDLPRLTSALHVRHGQALQVDAPVRQLALSCLGCSQPLDPTQDVRCEHCDHSVALPELTAVKPLLDQVEPLLTNQRPRQARPWGERLRRLRGDFSATNLFRLLFHARDAAATDERGYSYGDAWQVVSWLIIALAIWHFFF